MLLEVRRTPSERSVLDVDSFELTVADQGVGMSAEDQETIFEEFYQARERAQRVPGGTGLGLTIVRRFVDLLGGRIGVQSARGEGTVFRVELPIDIRG